MVRVAVTGGVACGKSLVGSFLADEGAVVCEADVLAHKLMEPERPVFWQIVRAFGESILGADGAIDRQLLGNRVFSNLQELTRLNAIVHPEVKKAWQKWLRKQNAEFERNPKSEIRNPKSKVAAVIIPLLYEAGCAGEWNAVVCVSASKAVQIQRLMDRGLPEAEARNRIAAQMAVSEKATLADYVVINEGTKKLLREQTARVWRRILEM